MKMDTNTLVEWQKIEESTGLVYPWYTHPFLDEITKWNFSKCVVLETGGGRSTAWWRSRAYNVDTVEANKEWGEQIQQDCEAGRYFNGALYCQTIPDGTEDGKFEYFQLIPKGTQYDIIIVDGIYRTEMVEWAIEHFKGKGGILICDNFMQDYVWISPKAEELLAPYKMNQYVQPNHTNHEGRPWNTCYWVIN